jgi:hypothetical protein
MCRKILQSASDPRISDSVLRNNRLPCPFLNSLASQEKINGSGDFVWRLPGIKWAGTVLYREDQGKQPDQFFGLFGYSPHPGRSYLTASFYQWGEHFYYSPASITTNDRVVFNSNSTFTPGEKPDSTLTKCPSFTTSGRNIDVCTEFVPTNYPQSL